jgi:hypothetical protein
MNAERLNAHTELSNSELDAVSGGMNLDNVRESANVIDARGGYDTVGAYIIYFDANGKVSGYGTRK